jgi:ABC-type nickel/cobalt efflux system permease component RcnA
MYLLWFRLQLELQILQFLMTMSMLIGTALMLQLEQCQIDVLMRCSRLSP